MDVGPLQP